MKPKRLTLSLIGHILGLVVGISFVAMSAVGYIRHPDMLALLGSALFFGGLVLVFGWQIKLDLLGTASKTAVKVGPWERSIIVTYDTQGLTVSAPMQETVTLGWGDLKSVTIETTDQGPYTADVFWVLAAEAKILRIPSLATGMEGAIRKLGDLPGFDFKTVVIAMGSTTNQRFPVWTRGDI